ncbi:Late embryogenesis abundant protein LEA-2 subgroup domain-containing protein [Dioscorea alata]|uniref:Late embryogenesis abundant protein LEA-2 subgroup domain-containing protein n=1 Tax=Dioscorea alata TaxID=55571 RepID=A0ACB7WLQ2_DIOAL|nr:Late embryogenesis abundant protein LEA-2 subgroup domain-containing protein [Dioscorea alata]
MPPHPHPFPSSTTTNNTIKQNFLPPPPQATFSNTTQRSHQRLLPPHRKTNPLVWCGAILCFFFSLLLILSGILILIIFLFIKPRNPAFDIPNASLNTIVLLSPFYLNGDLTFLANFSNPNHKLDLIFDYISIELYFSDHLIAAQGLPPFTQRQGEQRLEAVHMISSEVYLPTHLLLELQKQMASNSVVYNIRGTFKVKVSFGVFHFTYWLYSRCFIQLSAPPSGVLLGRTCKTNK